MHSKGEDPNTPDYLRGDRGRRNVGDFQLWVRPLWLARDETPRQIPPHRFKEPWQSNTHTSLRVNINDCCNHHHTTGIQLPLSESLYVCIYSLDSYFLEICCDLFLLCSYVLRVSCCVWCCFAFCCFCVYSYNFKTIAGVPFTAGRLRATPLLHTNRMSSYNFESKEG